VSIGKALAKARRQAGLTVTQVSDQTRIREMIITAVEGDDFSHVAAIFMPGGTSASSPGLSGPIRSH
jgi:cytoskeletal protein RodZ